MTWLWLAWLMAIIVSFAALERYALRTNTNTLSRTVWKITRAWPPFPWVFGLVVGFLADHFFWPGQACDLFK